MKCTNEYSAFTPNALYLMKEAEDWFKYIVSTIGSEFGVRETEYLIHTAIGNVTAEMILIDAIKRKRLTK